MACRVEERTKLDEKFVQQFLINGSHPTETLLIPTGQLISNISKLIMWWQTAHAAVKNLNISFKCCSKYKSMDSFEICSSWGFWNCSWLPDLIFRHLPNSFIPPLLSWHWQLWWVPEQGKKCASLVSIQASVS